MRSALLTPDAPGLSPALHRRAFQSFIGWGAALRIKATGPRLCKIGEDTVPGARITNPAKLEWCQLAWQGAEMPFEYAPLICHVWLRPLMSKGHRRRRVNHHSGTHVMKIFPVIQRFKIPARRKNGGMA